MTTEREPTIADVLGRLAVVGQQVKSLRGDLYGEDGRTGDVRRIFQQLDDLSDKVYLQDGRFNEVLVALKVIPSREEMKELLSKVDGAHVSIGRVRERVVRLEVIVAVTFALTSTFIAVVGLLLK